MQHSNSQEIYKLIRKIAQSDCDTSDMQELLTAVRTVLSQVMDTTNFSVNYYDHEKDSIKFLYHANEKDSIEDYDKEYYDRYAIENVGRLGGFTPEVIRTGKPLLIKTEKDSEENSKLNLRGLGTPSKVWLGVPLTLKNTVIGALSVQSYSKSELYGSREINILTAVAGQIALAIEHKKLMETQNKNEEIKKTLFSIANAVNITLNLQELYRFIHSTLNRVMDLPNFYIALYDSEKALLKFPYAVDAIDHPEQSEFTVDIKSLEDLSLTMIVIETRKKLLINKKKILQLCREKHKKIWGPIAEVWFGVPLQIKNNVIGAMCTQSYSESFHFNEKDLEILISVSDQVAIAIDRKRADEEAQKRSERLMAINRIGNAAANAHNLEKLMETIYEEINLTFRPDGFFIAFFDAATRELEFRFLVEEKNRRPLARYPLGNGFSSKVIMEKKSLVIKNYLEEQHVLPQPLNLNTPTQPLSWIGVPITSEDRIIGLVNIQSYKAHAWDEEDIQLFFTITDQISGTIAKARLYESVQLELNERKKAEEEARRRAERLTVINRIGKLAATATNLGQLLASIYGEINTAFKPMVFFIAFYRSEKEELEFRYMVRKGQKSEGLWLPVGNGLSAKIIREKKILIINDYEKEKDQLPPQMALPSGEIARTWIGAPFIFEDQVIGIASIQSFEPDAWNEEDLQFFFTIADQITDSIAKARLYEALEQELNERKKAEEENKKLESQLR
ncbi:MAG: GAF domain-containing protein, partial [Desulfobacteraceae bacterium]